MRSTATRQILLQTLLTSNKINKEKSQEKKDTERHDRQFYF